LVIDESNPLEYARLTCPNHISLQDHPFICPIETSLIPLLVYRNGIQSALASSDHRLLFIPSFDYLYLYHIPFIPKTPYSLYLYSSFIFFLCYGVLILPLYILHNLNPINIILSLQNLQVHDPLAIPPFPSSYRSAEVHCEANSPIPSLLAGLLSKLGIFGILRSILPPF